jgi:hypothetical protein
VKTDIQIIVSSSGEKVDFAIKLERSIKEKPTFSIVVEKSSSDNTFFSATVQLTNLKKTSTFRKNSPFLQISRPVDGKHEIISFKSEVIPKAQSCTFKRISIPMETFCQNDKYLLLKFQVFDFCATKPPTLIGTLNSSLQNLFDQEGGPFVLYDSQNIVVGRIEFQDIQLEKIPTLFDYLRAGLQLNLITAIDFSLSNKISSDPNSFHYLDNLNPNQYEKCIEAIGSVLCPYDSDQEFQVYGFHGKEKFFKLTGESKEEGWRKVRDIYRNALPNIQMFEPTLLAQVIRQSASIARDDYQKSKVYSILLILTDGKIDDLDETTNEIIAASNDSPLSIIIIGIGNGKFDAMKFLDSDGSLLKNKNGKTAKRDIVQFVKFQDFAHQGLHRITNEVLYKVPTQVREFCSSHGFLIQISH